MARKSKIPTNSYRASQNRMRKQAPRLMQGDDRQKRIGQNFHSSLLADILLIKNGTITTLALKTKRSAFTPSAYLYLILLWFSKRQNSIYCLLQTQPPMCWSKTSADKVGRIEKNIMKSRNSTSESQVLSGRVIGTS